MPSEKHSFSRRPLRNVECVHTKSLHLCLTLCNTMDCRWPGFSVHGILQARILEWVAIPSFRGIFLAQGSNSHLLSLLHWQVGILPPAPPGTLWPPQYSPWNSPGQNTGVGSLSLLQRAFPTQGLNPGLPHCRRILYQLSQKGSPAPPGKRLVIRREHH